MWIALNYVSLKYWIQLCICINRINLSCELLWIMYLWNIEYNTTEVKKHTLLVVNCFELCIFEILNTTWLNCFSCSLLLWIALNYVSLKYWIQLVKSTLALLTCCELLWIMYLWNIEYNFFYDTRLCRQLWIALNYVSLKYWIQLF